jgi:hypothetical protein
VLPSSPGSTPPVSEWTQLATYSNFCHQLGKPLIIDEFGLQLDRFDRSTVLDYFNYAFESAFKTKPRIPVIQVWNWKPGPTFDLFPGEDDDVIAIIRKYALLWGFSEDRFATISTNLLSSRKVKQKTFHRCTN